MANMNLLESYKGRLAVSESYYAKSHNGEKLSQNKKLVVAKLLETLTNSSTKHLITQLVLKEAIWVFSENSLLT
jgi:hypothetical protein